MFIPKKIMVAIGGVAILVAGIFIGGSFESGTETLPPPQAAAGGGGG